MAASGVSPMAFIDDDSAATAQGAQQPLGSMSATPSVPTGDRAGESVGDVRGADEGPNPNTENQAGSGPSADQPTAAAPGGGDSKSLPFTGFVAIPLMLLGAALLAVGVVGRRRPLTARSD